MEHGVGFRGAGEDDAWESDIVLRLLGARFVGK